MWNGRWDRVGSHVGCQCDGIEGGVDGPPEIKGNRRGFRTDATQIFSPVPPVPLFPRRQGI